MKPPARPKQDFEQVAVGEMIIGIIEEVQYDQTHTFKGFQGKEDTVGVAVRFKFKLTGYQYAHYSRWMRLSLNKKANLYLKYAVKLIEGIQPDADIDLDILNGAKIKVIYSENDGFQNVDSVFPDGAKVKIDTVPTVDLDAQEEPPAEDSQEIPF